MRKFIKIIAENLQPEVVEDDGDVAHALHAAFDDEGEAYIRYWKTRDGYIVIQSMHSGPGIRGRDMLRWLNKQYDLPIAVVEATHEAMGFWDRMQKEGLVYSVDGADGMPSPLEKKSIPIDQEPTHDDEDELRENVHGSPAFQKWFGKSQVVDQHGDPLIVYHGTDKDFEAFDIDIDPKAYESDRGKIFFTSDKEQADYYASELAGGDLRQSPNRGAARVIQAYVSMQNPWVIDNSDDPVVEWDQWGDLYAKEAKAGGHDGIIIHTEDGKDKLIVALDPRQIKSVDNHGTFDPDDHRMRH